MARGRKSSLTITLTPEEYRTLQAWQRSTTIRSGLRRRARIILRLADGIPISHVAATVGISRRFVYKWVQRFLEQGIEGLAHRPGRGGYPLGSGGMESANKCICHVRLKRSGAWWYEDSSNQMLALRCAKYNGAFAQVFTRYQHQRAGS
jgi:hypothetical protein